MEMSGLIVIICVCVLGGFHCNVEGRSLNETRVHKFKMMRSNDSSHEFKMMHANDSMSTTFNLPKNGTLKESSRKPKFLAHLSFLTGLGIGSLASAAAFSDPNIPPPGNLNNLFRTPSTTTTTTTRSPLNDVNLNFGAAEFPPAMRLQPVNSNQNYDYSAALSTSAIFNQSLRTIERILKQLKTKKAEEEGGLNQAANDYDEVVDDGANDINVEDNGVTINCSMLRDIIRSTVAKEIEKTKRKPTRQATPVDQDEGSDDNTAEEPPEDAAEMGADESNNSANKNKTTITTTTTTTQITPTMPQFPGYYYGGNPQNVSGIDITSGAYGPPKYPIYPPISQPNEIYGLPAYGAVPFRHEYTPEAYLVYPDSSGDGFTSVIDSQPDYSRYARGNKFITKASINLNDRNSFVPSPFVSRV